MSVVSRRLSLPHLSDEAVAAFADGVLRDAPRARAGQHLSTCPECALAVRNQRSATFALRAATSPTAPVDLLARLRALPSTTALLTAPVSGLGEDGRPMFAAYGHEPTAIGARASAGTGSNEPTVAHERSVADSRRHFLAGHLSGGHLIPSLGLGAVTAAAAVVVATLASTAGNAGGTTERPAPTVPTRATVQPAGFNPGGGGLVLLSGQR